MTDIEKNNSFVELDAQDLEQVSGGTILRYLVQPGDTVQSIADKYHVTKEQLMKWNSITNPDALKAGQQVKVMY